MLDELESTDAAGQLDRLKALIAGTLADCMGEGRRFALLEFPSYANVGDSAIWAGEIAFLVDHIGRLPALTADIYDYSRERIAAIRDLHGILISGGGNLSDLWPAAVDSKIRVLEDFPETPILQLPQTLYFQNSARFDDYRRAVARHRKFTLLVRDRAGFDLANAALDCEVRLCPDMALWLNLRRPQPPRHKVICLLRDDIEAHEHRYRVHAAKHADIPVFDWLDELDELPIQVERKLTDILSRYPRKLAACRGLLTRARNNVAWTRVRRGCALLSLGKVVVTDRLHGHILSLLMGIPHVVLDNSYGKVRAFHQSWTQGCPNVRFATSFDQALDEAHKLTAIGHFADKK